MKKLLLVTCTSWSIKKNVTWFVGHLDPDQINNERVKIIFILFPVKTSSFLFSFCRENVVVMLFFCFVFLTVYMMFDNS